MIAPLNIHVFESNQFFNNFVGSRTAIKNIAHNMNMVYADALNGIRKSTEKIIGILFLDNCVDQRIIIASAVNFTVIDFEQLANQRFVFVRQLLTNLLARILGSDKACDFNELQNDFPHPTLIVKTFPLFLQRQFRIVNDGGEFILVILG